MTTLGRLGRQDQIDDNRNLGRMKEMGLIFQLGQRELRKTYYKKYRIGQGMGS